MAEKIIVTQQRLGYYDTKLKAWVMAKDAEVLAAAKAHAEEYANGLADNYEAAGSVATAQQTLEALITAEQERAEGVEGELSGEITRIETWVIGDVDKLTTDNNILVEAINEVNELAANNSVGLYNANQKLGDTEDLQTTNKADLVSAINEVKNSVAVGGTAAVVTMTTDTTTEGALKSYTIFQGENKVGTIDIPKDMVVETGEVVVNPEGQAEGTYIKLVLANVAEPLFINVGTLVDIYKAAPNATQVQVTIDSSTREISAAIVAGSVGTTELADNAVVTAKIADGNVTKAKLSTAVQGSLDKADAAAPQTALDAEVERATVAEAKALEDANAHTDAEVAKDRERLVALEEKFTGEGSVESQIEDAVTETKGYADTKVGELAEGAVADNTAAIEALEGVHATDKAALEAKDTELQGNIDTLSQTHATDKAALEQAIADLDASFTEITEATIDGWFAE